MWRSRRISLVVCALVLAACGTSNEEIAINASPTVPAITAATTTTLAPTTTTVAETTTSTTLAATTTEAPTTTTEAPTTTTEAPIAAVVAPAPLPSELPEPVAPPPPRANEPVVELGTIEIPAIGVAKTMFEGITLNTLDRGPGHWPGTAGPGDYGNMVVAGHRTSHDRPFYDLDKLAVGDQIVFSNLAGRHVYAVTETLIVNPDAIWITDQTAEKIVTLFACHPKGSTRQRIVIRAAFVETQAV